ncbi:probable G-protein coupled receptor CG31760 [Cloeon dipterum]|uniref:probable G-protein coupled receptor CG31760 n=1 Tax=Cloeon dipterum TaxID=197152 RepID=UPI0032203795
MAGWRAAVALWLLLLFAGVSSASQEATAALTLIHDIATQNTGALCSEQRFQLLPLAVANASLRFDATRQKVDLIATLLQDVGLINRSTLLEAMVRNLLSQGSMSTLSARIIVLNMTSNSVMLSKAQSRNIELKQQPTEDSRFWPTQIPWMPRMTESEPMQAPRFMPPVATLSKHQGRWTVPYYSCGAQRWLMSYTAVVRSKTVNARGLISIDVDLSNLDVNQCEPNATAELLTPFQGTHKCHRPTSTCEAISGRGWVRGAYRCHCLPGYYSRKPLQPIFNGTLVEQAWEELEENRSNNYRHFYQCQRCAPGCSTCSGPELCLAEYNWPFRIALLTISCACVVSTLLLICYVTQHRKLKVFKVASPIFLSITLLGCAIMYLEMAAIFPVLDVYSCIATKWTRHLGFCVTYTALLMKTWRVSLTYRVKSAHKVKLTDKQLLQWMFPILLVMLIYLGTWTLSAAPIGEDIYDHSGLRFKQCTYNWWDHSLAIGEVLFLAWGIRVCYNVRNAESLFNEARLITYAIYNIAAVNIAMVAFHLLIFPRAGPDIKYLLGFVRTQLGTTTTVALVFGPKIFRVLRGQGDQYDSRARARGVTASFSLNGIGLVPEEPPDLYQENEELKEEVQKLAAQIEFMRIVHMEINNRHLKPKPGGYFSGGGNKGGGGAHRSAEPSDVSTSGQATDGGGGGAERL